MTTIPLVTAATEEKWHKRYPKPTTTFFHNPMRWLLNKVVELGESVPAGHIVLLAWIAVYFILFESIHPVKQYWDTLFSQHIHLLSQHNWNNWRHFFRNGGEAFLVTITVLFMTFNPYVHKHKKIHTAGQVVGRFFFAIACAIPFMIGFGLLFHGIQHWLHTGTLSPSVGSHPNLAQKLYSDQWTTKVSVVLAALVARRPMYPVYAFVQEYFAERRVVKGKRDHWWHPAPFRAMVRELKGKGVSHALHLQINRSSAVVWLMSGGMIVVLGLAAYGAYILNHYA